MPSEAPDRSAQTFRQSVDLKRAFDVAVSASCAVLFGWLLLLPMLGIRLTSPGPAIFAQRRVGRNQRPFLCYKLRTMDTGTPSAATHETPSTAVTPVGKVLRMFKIDEMPQLYNVLIGDMSLVGPRPCLPQQRELILCRERLNVFSVRPGITGKAQVMGIDMSDPARLAEIDAAYVRERTFAGDLMLIGRTLMGSGSGDRVRRT